MNITNDYIHLILSYLKKHLKVYRNLMVDPNEYYPVLPFDKLYKLFELISRTPDYSDSNSSLLMDGLFEIMPEDDNVFIPTAIRKTPYVVGFENWGIGWYLFISWALKLSSEHKINRVITKKWLDYFLEYLKKTKPCSMENREILIFDDYEASYLTGGKEGFLFLINPDTKRSEELAMNWLGNFFKNFDLLTDYAL